MNPVNPARTLQVALHLAWVPAIAWGALCIAMVAYGADASVKTAARTVTIDGVAYLPATLTVRRGDVVVWTNKDPFPHTVTAAGAFDSRDIAAGASWRFTPRKTGVYDYICTLHPNMKGTLKVE